MKTKLHVFGFFCLMAVGALLLSGPSTEAPGRRLVPRMSPAAMPVAQTDTLFEIIRSPSYLGEVEFPHLMHYDEDELDIDCEDCHHETNASVLSLPHEEYFEDFWIDCTTCHHPSGEVTQTSQACSSCHPDSPRTIADEALSAKVVIHENCWECHESGTGAEAAENCKFCHTGPRLTY